MHQHLDLLHLRGRGVALGTSKFVLVLATLGLGVFLGRQLTAERKTGAGHPQVDQAGQGAPVVPTRDLSRFPAAGNTPLPDGDDALLARVLEQVDGDYSAPGFDNLASISKAQYLADAIYNQPPFATVDEALIAMLPPARAAEVRACMQAGVDQGDLPADYLTRSLDGRASLWDPIGRTYLEQAFLGEASMDEARAMLIFQRRLQARLLLGKHREALFGNPAIFPDPAAISDGDRTALGSVFDRHEAQLLDRIRDEVFYGTYIDAIRAEIAKGAYEALPNGVDASYLSHCRQDQGRRRVIDLQVAVSGWDGCLIIYEGAYPKYDELLNEIEALRKDRDTELEQLILALR